MKAGTNMEQHNRQVPPVSPENYGKRMRRLWGPILIDLAIGIVVSTAAVGVLAFLYMAAHSDVLEAAMQNEDQMLGLYEKIIELYYGFMTVIQGVAAAFTIPVMWYLFHQDRLKEKAAGVIPNKKAPLWQYLAGILMAFALNLALNNLIVIGNIADISETYQQTLDAFYSAALPVQIICLGILTPISEELVFRGLLFKRLRETSAYLQAAVYSAVVFGLMHGNLVQMLFGFIMGMMLSYLYEKYGSVKAPIAAHITINLLSVLATKFELMNWLMEDPMRIGVVTVVCAAVASTMFVLIQRIEEKPDIPGTSEENENLASV